MSTTADAKRAADARWKARRRRLIGYGQWEPFVDAEPVRAHVRAIQETGLSTKLLEGVLDLPRCAFKNLMWGSNGRPPATKVRKETAAIVLAFWPSLDDFADCSRIDPTGSRRRMQAMATLGWTNSYVAERIGLRPTNLRRGLCQERLTAWLARGIRDVYNEVWMRPPMESEVSAWVALRAVRAAQQKGWDGPLAWDDETIDDPRAVPQTDAAAPAATEGGNVADRWLMGESVILGAEDRKQVLQHLFEWTNDTPEEIAAQLEMTVDAMWAAWSRIKKKARQEGRTEPWRRVYVPRERDLNQNQMEEVA